MLTGTKRRISRYRNHVPAAEVYQLILLQKRMILNLIDARNRFGLFNQRAEFFDAKVRNAEGSGQPLVVRLFHTGPGNVGRQFVRRNHIRIGRRQINAFFLGNRPVHQIQIQIIKLQILQSLLQGRQNVLTGVRVVPKFGNDKQFLSFYVAFVHRIGQGLSDFLFIAVYRRAVNMPITILDGPAHGLINFARL